ncbi:hypothetical protein ACF0H5_020008 [Mactra antiquata]
MLSIYASSGGVVEESNLRKFLDVIVKDKSKMAINKAGIVHENGNIAAATSRFHMSQKDLKTIKTVLTNEGMDRLSYNGVTYCIKSRTSEQLVAFNGSNYLIISKTDVTYVVVTCSSRQKHSTVAAWINAIAQKIRERHL